MRLDGRLKMHAVRSFRKPAAPLPPFGLKDIDYGSRHHALALVVLDAQRILLRVQINGRAPRMATKTIAILDKPEVITAAVKVHARSFYLIEAAVVSKYLFENSYEILADEFVAVEFRHCLGNVPRQRKRIWRREILQVATQPCTCWLTVICNCVPSIESVQIFARVFGPSHGFLLTVLVVYQAPSHHDRRSTSCLLLLFTV
jgi:hypothetical protein